MLGTVRSKFAIHKPPGFRSDLNELMQIIVVARDPLTAVPKFGTAVVPLPQSVNDHDLIPEGSSCLHGGDVRHSQIQPWQILINVWRDARNNVRVKSRLGSRFDFYGRADVVACCRRDSGIPEKETLAILIIRIHLEPEAPLANRSKCALTELIRQRASDICLAGFPDCIESPSTLLSAQRVKFARIRMLTKIIAENRYIDVF